MIPASESSTTLRYAVPIRFRPFPSAIYKESKLGRLSSTPFVQESSLESSQSFAVSLRFSGTQVCSLVITLVCDLRVLLCLASPARWLQASSASKNSKYRRTGDSDGSPCRYLFHFSLDATLLLSSLCPSVPMSSRTILKTTATNSMEQPMTKVLRSVAWMP